MILGAIFGANLLHAVTFQITLKHFTVRFYRNFIQFVNI